MGIIDPTENPNDECNNSRELTAQSTNSIKQQEHRYTVSDENIKSCKSSIKKCKDRTNVQQIQKIKRYCPRTSQFKLAYCVTY